MSLYINNKKIKPCTFMEIVHDGEKTDEVTGFADYCEGLAQSETKD